MDKLPCLSIKCHKFANILTMWMVHLCLNIDWSPSVANEINSAQRFFSAFQQQGQKDWSELRGGRMQPKTEVLEETKWMIQFDPNFTGLERICQDEWDKLLKSRCARFTHPLTSPQKPVIAKWPLQSTELYKMNQQHSSVQKANRSKRLSEATAVKFHFQHRTNTFPKRSLIKTVKLSPQSLHIQY